MDYGSVQPGAMLAMTGAGLGWLGTTWNQLWILALAAVAMGAFVLIVRTRFRRRKSVDEV